MPTTIICMFVVGCSPAPQSIPSAYVSPLVYQPYNCAQLMQEWHRIGRKTQEVASSQTEESSKDATAVGVGLLLWPAFFFLIGNDRKEEVARLKGEADALEQAAIQKDCKQVFALVQAAHDAAEKRRAIAAESAKKQKKEIEQGLHSGTRHQTGYSDDQLE